MNDGLNAEIDAIIDGPYESNRVYDTYWWERPGNHGDLGYNRPDVLLRCARIFGGRVKVIRVVEHSSTTVYSVFPPGSGRTS